MGKTLWGQTAEGEDIFTYTLEGQSGIRAKFMNYGANLLELWVPDANGKLADVVLSYQDPASFAVPGATYGALVGRHANRIGGAAFTLNGKTYHLEKNDGENNLHSAPHPLHQRIWDVDYQEDARRITFFYDSPDGDMGFPGELKIHVTYSLTEDNALRIDYEASSDIATVCNLTNHSYFNLAGHDQGNILDHILQLDSDAFTWASKDSIPDGRIIPVTGTPMDFRIPKTIGRDIDADYDELKWAGGYDHNWVLNTTRGTLSQFGSLIDPKSGRVMTFYTDLPGVQVYTGNFINPEEVGKGGVHYQPRDGVCFETQFFPNALNVPSFEQPVTTPGVPMKSSTVYKFTTL